MGGLGCTLLDSTGIEPGGAWHSLLELKMTCWSPVESNTVQPGAPKSVLVLPGGRTDKGKGCTRMDQVRLGVLCFNRH